MRAEEFIQEAPLPPDWDQSAMQIKKGTTFKSRVAYAKQQAQKLGTGSSRVAFVIDFEGRPTVLKVAKNQRGIAQNNEEVGILDDGYLGRLPIVIPLIDFDKESPGPDIAWLQTELAGTVKNQQELANWLGATPGKLREYAGTVTGKFKASQFKSPAQQQESILAQIRADGATEEKVERFVEYANMMAELSVSSSVDLVDFDWYKNWGWYQGRAVVIDVGFAGSAIPLYRGYF